MNTKDFRTKTFNEDRNNGIIKGFWEIALDIGYSAVKVMSPNNVVSFPSYARRIDDSFQFIGETPKEAILYKDLTTGEMWIVGEVAQNLIASGDTSDSESSLYGRDRYANDMYKVIANTGLGCGYRSNAIGGPKPTDKIVIQTGLPERYMNDEEDLISSLAGEHNFALKIGNGEWKDYNLTINAEDVFVMSQPKGTLLSVCINKKGQFIPEAKKYLSSSVLIADPGFGTFDVFPIVSGVVASGETYSDLGMKRVLQETAKLIEDLAVKENYNIKIHVPSMQKNLETGTVRFIDKKKFVAADYPIDKLLEEASAKVCEEAMNRLTTSFNLADFNYLIITGGTGAAWFDQIKNKFKGLSFLEIIKGNQNDNLDFIFANVRGYYLNRFNKLGKGDK